MQLIKGILKSFDETSYRAVVCPENSGRAYLEDIPVSRGLPASEMQADRKVIILFWNEYCAGDAVVISVYI
jgi:hypothetical protein